MGVLHRLAFAVIVVATVFPRQSFSAEHSFSIGPGHFIKDGQPFRVVSGSMHYFRVHPSSWQDRLRKLRTMGLNTIQTYIPWNFHQSRRDGPLDFSSPWRDVKRFVQLAQQEDLLVTIRPGPYVCAEWEWGGMPAWLLDGEDSELHVRCSSASFMALVDRFLQAALGPLAALQYNDGAGPIILLQVENEYGSYGNDHQYLTLLQDAYRKHGFTSTPFFASNSPTALRLEGGATSPLLRTANFNWNSDFSHNFQVLSSFQPDAPVFCTEWWDGWMSFWGFPPPHVPANASAAQLDALMGAKVPSRSPPGAKANHTPNDGEPMVANINLYMAHGGTNFGFFNGADAVMQPWGHGIKTYKPIVTSYDYIAPLNESGDPTEKYVAYRDVLKKYVDVPDRPIPPVTPKANYGSVALTHVAYFLPGSPSSSPSAPSHNLQVLTSAMDRSVAPRTMEQLGENFGFVLYDTSVRGPVPQPQELTLQSCADRCHVYLDSKRVGIVYRNDASQSVKVSLPNETHNLTILVENMGRVNFGPSLLDQRRGITQGVRVAEQFQYHWTSRALPFDNVQWEELVWESLSASSASTGRGTHAALFRGNVYIKEEPKDTFFSLEAFKTFTKGVAWINGNNIGRYWISGPQHTLYVPRGFLVQGNNTVVVLELDTPPVQRSHASVALVSTPSLRATHTRASNTAHR